MWIHLADVLANLPDSSWTTSWMDGGLFGAGFADATHFHWDLLAQQFDTDVFAGFRRTLSNFVKSGQIWAMLIGFVLGYMIRGITTYS